jgi:hypothetical protein
MCAESRAPRNGKQWAASPSKISATAGGTGCNWALGGDGSNKGSNDTFISIAAMRLSWSSSRRLMSSISTRLRSSCLVKVVVVAGSVTSAMVVIHHDALIPIDVDLATPRHQGRSPR